MVLMKLLEDNHSLHRTQLALLLVSSSVGLRKFAMLTPCPGCGALFPPFEEPTHRYIGASAGCWALLNWTVTIGGPDTTGLVAQSRIPENPVHVPAHRTTPPLEALFGDAYGV
jgi:hypothetical protein